MRKHLTALIGLLALVLLLAVSTSSASSKRHYPHPHHHGWKWHHPCRTATPYVCAWRLSYRWYGWRGPEWKALDALVRRESGWDPCAHWPGVHHDCGYTGTNACGIPQRYYCPPGWQGHLEKWRRQVRWMLKYIWRNYGDPITAYNNPGGY